MRYFFKPYSPEYPLGLDSNKDWNNNHDNAKSNAQPLPEQVVTNPIPGNVPENEKQTHVKTPDDLSSIRSQLDNIL